MRIEKVGHCCLRITIGESVLLTDPGAFTDTTDPILGVDVVLITHEHADHVHIPFLKKVLTRSPKARIVTNTAVGKLLAAEGLSFQVLEGDASDVVAGIALTARDGRHAEIYEDVGQVQNTGYLIGKRLFYPGDAYTNPKARVEILALPVAGPWCRIADAIRYALAVSPRHAFPVHDGLVMKERRTAHHTTPAAVLSKKGIIFTPLNEGDVLDIPNTPNVT